MSSKHFFIFSQSSLGCKCSRRKIIMIKNIKYNVSINIGALFTEHSYKKERGWNIYLYKILWFLRDLRTNIENDEIKERSLLMNILHTWQMLKKLREHQGFINTSTTLKVRKYVRLLWYWSKLIEILLYEYLKPSIVIHETYFFLRVLTNKADDEDAMKQEISEKVVEQR